VRSATEGRQNLAGAFGSILMYKIKQKPEDFSVKEISTIKIGDQGKYTYFLLRKRNYTTLRALEMTAKQLNIPLKKMGFAGNKDKKAITEQMCSAEGASETRLNNIKLKDISAEFKGKGSKPICLGDLKGNKFEIVIRNTDSKPKLRKTFVNYFGEQRFSKNNAEIGKAIVKKDFKKAIKLILEGKGTIEREVKKHLEKSPCDYIGGLKRIPKKILSIYIHAYQSLLWNKQAKNSSQEIIPIIGFDSQINKNIMQEEKIKCRDFIIKQMPELSFEGGERKRIVKAENASISELQEDEMNTGKKKIILKFSLPKASYATEYIRQLFSN